MAYAALQLHFIKDNVLRISHPSLPETPATYLVAPNLASATNLTVRDNTAFSNALGGDLILIGKFGEEQAEIKQINGAITAGTSLTTTALTFAHPINTPVRKILFDQIEIYGNTTASSSGAVLIATINIDPTAEFTDYVISGATSAFYGTRPIRSVATTYQGSYSDFISASGYSTDTVGFIIKNAFEAVGEKIKEDGMFSRSWAYDQIFLGEQDIAGELKKWSWLQEFEYNVGNIALGVNSFTLPANIADKNTPKCIQGIRIGTGNNLTYISKAEFEFLFQNVAKTTVGTTYAVGANTVVLTDSKDFPDSGSINVYTNNTIDAISYTTNTRSINTITGVTSNDSGGTAGDPVWFGEPQGRPSRYTIYEGTVYFDTVPDTSVNLVGLNIWIDYYKQVTRVTSDGDSITVPDPLCIQHWLEAMIKKYRAGGKLDQNDTSWIEYLKDKKRLINNETSGQRTSLVPSFFSDYNYRNQGYY